MKRSFITLYTLAVTALTAVTQPRFTPNTETYDFGQIEWRHPATVQYSITNTGNQSLALIDMEPDCACSVARWTKTPIASGAKGVVDVTFDAGTLGRFNKSVAIYSNTQPRLIYLKFNREVAQEIKDFTKTHPYLIGQICIDKNSLGFPDVQAGEKPVIHIGVVNLSNRSYEPVLIHLPPYPQTEVKPNVLQKGEKGIITATLDSERLTNFGLAQASIYLACFSDDKVGDEDEIPVSAILLPDFSGMTEAKKADAPVVNLSIKGIDMSAVSAKKSEAHQDIIIANTGCFSLRTDRFQTFHPAVDISLGKSVLQPGENTRLRVTVVKKNIGKRRRHLRLLMIANDPMQLKVEINIKMR